MVKTPDLQCVNFGFWPFFTLYWTVLFGFFEAWRSAVRVELD